MGKLEKVIVENGITYVLGDKIRNKEIKNYINVSVVVDIECGNTTE